MQFNQVLSEHLVVLINRFATPSASRRDIRDVSFCNCLQASAVVLRYDYLSRLGCSDLYFLGDHIALYVSKIKTDQL